MKEYKTCSFETFLLLLFGVVSSLLALYHLVFVTRFDWSLIDWAMLITCIAVDFVIIKIYDEEMGG